MDLTTAVEVLVSISEGEAPRDQFLEIVREDFGPGSLFSPTSGVTWGEDDDSVDWDLLDY